MAKFADLLGGWRPPASQTAHRPASPSISADDVPANPMQAVVDALQTEHGGRGVTLDMVVARAMESGLSGGQIANMSEVNFRGGITFTESGVNRVRDLLHDSTDDRPLNLRGADIGGSVFHPASTVNHIVFDSLSVGQSTGMQFLLFDGFTNAPAEFNMFGQEDVSYFQVKGEDGSPSRNMTIRLSGNVALGGDISDSSYTQLIARPSPHHQPADLSGLDASNARALRLDVSGCEVSGSHFGGASIAPDSQMTNCNLIGVDFSGAVLGNLNLSGSRLYGAKLDGVELAQAGLRGTQIRPEDLVGALNNGMRITDTQQAMGFMRDREMVMPGHDVSHEISLVEQRSSRIDRVRSAGRERHASTEPERVGKSHQATADSSLSDTDRLIAALQQAHETLYGGGVARTVSDAGRDQASLVAGAEPQLAQFRVEHDGRVLT